MPRQRAITAYGYLLPSIAVLGAVVLYPVLFGLYASFHDWNWALGQAEGWKWTGLGNYLTLLRDGYFWHSVGVTLYFTVVAVAVEFILGFAIALLLAQDIKGAWFFRAATVFPLMVSDIVAALLWGMILNPSLGILNYGLSVLHLPGPDWVGNPQLVVPTLAAVDAWWQTGNIVLILLAGLSGIPKDRFEMASIDGAHGWRMLWHITIPSLMPFILVALVFRTIDCLRVFALAWGITSGGPLRASEFSQLFIYTQGFGRLFNMGYAAAASVVFALIVGVVVIFYVGPMQRRLSA
ncbi:MAG: sugar ABC transporter permease [Bacillota bacterium]|nr:sugar ABC transporter permease [Bacillota bacterium]